MRYLKRILMIDDEKDSHRVLEGLPSDEYKVYTELSGEEGVARARSLRPDVILLDYYMNPLSGLGVCQKLRANPETADLPVIMFTQSSDINHYRETLRYAGDYIEKGVRLGVLLAKLDASARAFRPYPEIFGHQTLTVRCVSGESLSFRTNRRSAITSSSGRFPDHRLHRHLAETLQFSSKALYGSDPSSSRDDWRPLAKTAGWDLFEKVFRSYPELLAELQGLRTAAGKDRLVHLEFESSSALLQLPLEYLYDKDPMDSGEFLAVRHPFARTLVGSQRFRTPISRSWLNEVRHNYNESKDTGGCLRILLIASNTLPDLPGVDAEIDVLAENLGRWFADLGVPAEVVHLPTEKASIAEVRRQLQECSFNIVHYAGHGIFNPEKPEKSSLLFWSENGKKGHVVPLSARAISSLLENSDVRFLYLSCCSGSATADSDRRLTDDFLGLLDAAATAQVPAILGFRWPASDEGAKLLAESFYKALASDGELDSALRRARAEVRERLPDDPSWLSPILVSHASS